jgi:hypothetical protein
MNKKPIHLPSGYSEFNYIRSNNLLYVDKTEYIHNLISDSSCKNWFLARPRRFGKTMFIDTMEQFFLGHEEPFRGLNIYSKGYDFKPCPVIRLNMARSAASTEELKSSIIFHLGAIAEDKGLTVKSQNPGEALARLIKDLYGKNDQRQVVVLIDEYDKPIFDHINKPNLAIEMVDALRNFFIGLKKSEKYLRFVFVTGISKFGKPAIQPALNNLIDITHSPLYAGICGFTETELINNYQHLFNKFLSHLIKKGIFKKGYDQNVLINSILSEYNGYSWDGTTKILNPYTINNCFSDKEFGNYWWQTGPPLLWAHAMASDPMAFLRPNWENLPAEELDSLPIGERGSVSDYPVSVLFQTGYLTIDTINTVSEEVINSDGSKSVKNNTFYSLKIPNNEILSFYESALLEHIFPHLSYSFLKDAYYKNIANSIKEKNTIDLIKIFSANLSSLHDAKYLDRIKSWGNDPTLGESFFQALLLRIFAGSGLRVITEPLSSRWQSDIDILLDDDIYVVFEIKYLLNRNKNNKLPRDLKKSMDKTADEAINKAFSTLQNKKYINKAKKIIIAGIVIYDHHRVLVKFADNI